VLKNVVEVLMVIADGRIRYSLCGFRGYNRGVNLFKFLPTVLVHRDLFSHKNRPYPFCEIRKVGMRSDFLKNKAKTLENLVFSRVWSCWADSNRRPHPYQRENLTFSSRFSSIEPYSLHFIYFPPLFSHRFSTASTAGCGCLCGQKAFPPKTLGYRESLFLFTVYLCHLKLATPLSEQFLGNFLRFFRFKSSLQKWPAAITIR